MEQAKKEFLLDLETEKQILGKHQHSIYHICPTHGTGIYQPLQNDCIDCLLFLSGKDVRTLLATQKAEIRSQVMAYAVENDLAEELAELINELL